MSIRFEISETIRASPEQVLDAILDLEQAHRWIPGLVRMETVTTGPIDVGSEWRETRRLLGKEATEQFRVIGLDRPHRLELLVDGTKGSSGRGEYRFSYRIEGTGEATAVRLSGEIRGMTGIMALLGKLLVGPYRKACRKDLAALRSYLEGDGQRRAEDGGAVDASVA